MASNDLYRNYPFRLEINGLQQAAFSEVSGLDVPIDPVDYRNGDGPAHVRKLAGLTKCGNITLKRGITGSTELHDWHRRIIDGYLVHKEVTIILLDQSGNETARFEIAAAWPARYNPVGLNAKSNEFAIEILELGNEGVRRVA